VRLLSAHAGDDRIALALVRALGDVVDDVVHAHRDLDAGLEVVAAADVVVGARLHSLVAAAAAGTRFLGLAYRPKVADFGASVGCEDQVAPIDQWTEDRLVTALRPGSSDGALEEMRASVEDHRARLQARTQSFLAALAPEQ
jgi:polysaccharide pyruvyl transferase WcaK-like protein